MKISAIAFMLSAFLSTNIEAHHTNPLQTDTLEQKTNSLQDLLNSGKDLHDSFGMNDYSGFVDSVNNVYRKFRMDCNKKYAEFVREAWKQYNAEPPVEKPQMNKIRVIPVADTTQRVTTAAYKVAKVVRKPSKRAQPTPIFKIPEEKPFLLDDMPEARKDIEFNKDAITSLKIAGSESGHESNIGYEWTEFYFYGTKCKVRLGKSNKFILKDCQANTIADTWLTLSDARFSNAIKDCLTLRDAGQLCDWAYLQMLKSLSETFCGEGTNEATMLTAYIYCQSGYKMRLATVDDKLYMLYGTKNRLYNNFQYYIIEDAFFYPLQKCENNYMDICNVAYPKEQELSLLVWTEQRFNMKPTDSRNIQSYRYPELTVEVDENKNLIDFYNSYPSPEGEENFMTRWVMYANTPMSSHARAAIYPTLHKQLEGCTQLEAVNKLLNFVQTGFVYKLDDEVWGEDRAFFADETLFYPYSDCEDRSILFSRLVRDLLGMRVALVYYPGHLATAVHFDESVDGDCIMVENDKYVICDPTYTHACAGWTMPQMDNNTATAILLE